MFRSILFVEDEAEYREIMVDLLSEGFDRVITACNGNEAIEIAKSENLSVILSDVNMPELTGDGFLRHLRAAGVMTPVVFLTGHADKELAVSVLRLGAADIIDKPASFEKISACLDRVIEIARREAEAAKADSEEEAKKAQKMVGLLRAVNDTKRKSG